MKFQTVQLEQILPCDCTGKSSLFSAKRGSFAPDICLDLFSFFFFFFLSTVGNYMFKVKKRNTRTSCETCSNLTIKTPEQRQWLRSGVFIVNLEHISDLALVFLL